MIQDLYYTSDIQPNQAKSVIIRKQPASPSNPLNCTALKHSASQHNFAETQVTGSNSQLTRESECVWNVLTLALTLRDRES